MVNGRWSKLSWALVVIGLCALVTGCSDDPEATNGDPDDAGHGDVGDVGSEDVDDGEDADTEIIQHPPDYGIETHFRCHEEPPEGAAPPPELQPYSGGECPQLEVGFNTLESSGYEREFKIVAPQEIEDGEVLPVIFMWHWLAGTAQRFVDEGDIQKAVDTVRFLAVVPESGENLSGDLQWPFMNAGHHLDAYDEELTFFDDMLTCVHESFEIERNCVASAGVSAGGLWTTQLASQRSEYLSSFVSLAGGVQDGAGVGVRPWEEAERKLPGIVLWGGPDDWCIIDFEETSELLEDHLQQDGHFFLECVHNCGHTKPPTEPGEGEAEMAAFWQFVLDHPLWVKEGSSPYTHEGLPDDMPEWCGIGKGSAEIRQGECEPDQC